MPSPHAVKKSNPPNAAAFYTTIIDNDFSDRCGNLRDLFKGTPNPKHQEQRETWQLNNVNAIVASLEKELRRFVS